MTYLPIQFHTKLRTKEFGELKPTEVLDIVENYLREKGFNYVQRTESKIVFHKSNFWTSIDLKSFLVSGIVTIKKNDDILTITNGNWMVFLIAVPFIPILLIADSDFSTLDEFDIRLIWGAFFWLFGGNLFARIIAHLSFKSTLKKLIKKTVPNNS